MKKARWIIIAISILLLILIFIASILIYLNAKNNEDGIFSVNAQKEFKGMCEEIQGMAVTKIAGSKRMTTVASCIVNHPNACATTSGENFEYDFGSPELTQEVLDNTPSITKTEGIKPIHQKIIDFCNDYGWIATCHRLDEGYSLECMFSHDECTVNGAYVVDNQYCVVPNNRYYSE
jgi:hypothetical protein